MFFLNFITKDTNGDRILFFNFVNVSNIDWESFPFSYAIISAYTNTQKSYYYALNKFTTITLNLRFQIKLNLSD